MRWLGVEILRGPQNYFTPLSCCVFYHPLPVWGKGERGREMGRKEWGKGPEEISWGEIDIPGILSSLINFLFISSTLHESKYCEKPDRREATDWNCTFGINCIDEILVEYWIPWFYCWARLTLVFCIQVMIMKKVPMSYIFIPKLFNSGVWTPLPYRRRGGGQMTICQDRHSQKLS